MTALPAQRLVVNGKPRTATTQIRTSRTSRSISVTKTAYDRIAAVAKQHGCTMADVVRAACANILGPDAR